MRFNKEQSQIYVPSGEDVQTAFSRTTHLAIVAHQDDVEFMAYHGIEKCYNSQSFGAVVVTNGSGSPRTGRFAGFSNEQMIQVRIEEQKKASDMGKYSLLALLMYPSNEVKSSANTQTVDDIYNILSACKPSVVYTHNLADKHDTHVATALRTISAIRRMPASDQPSKVYGCEVWRDLDWLEDGSKELLDVSSNQQLAREIMQVFASQIEGGKRYDLAVTGRRVANATFLADHDVDVYTHLTYAMNLMPLVQNPSLSVADFVQGHIDEFKNSVLGKLNRLA